MVTPSQETSRADSPLPETPAEIFRKTQYKRCTIQATSYSVGPTEWVPEAYFWKYTETGWRRFWIQSFDHLFSKPGLTFPTQRDADFHAFGLARTLIDTMSGELPKPAGKTKLSWASYLSKLLRTS
ncbi:MAG TPA: hypothetical protein VNL14_07045 [Candidatus Acidoferrales bacterium]|nr:hypothetical protein [Candidatus Acidoferrales bacterium]